MPSSLQSVYAIFITSVYAIFTSLSTLCHLHYSLSRPLSLHSVDAIFNTVYHLYAIFTTVCLCHLHYSVSMPSSLHSVYAIFTTVCLCHLHSILSLPSLLQSVFAIFTTVCLGHLHYCVSRPSLLHALHTQLNFLTCSGCPRRITATSMFLAPDWTTSSKAFRASLMVSLSLAATSSV